MDGKKTCFVITPIGDDSAPIRRHIDGIIDQAIIPAIGEEFNVKVAHREYEIGSINDRVIQNVYSTDLVIANLTGLNPNVMFEIAIRYSFGKPAIVIAEKGTKLPFDIVDENTIFYINDPVGAADLKKTIREFTKKINWEKNEYGPVFAAIKNAAVINTIETGILDKDNKNAFTYLVKKISDLESEIKRQRADECFQQYDSSKQSDNMERALLFLRTLERHQNDFSKDDVKRMVKIFLYNKLGQMNSDDWKNILAYVMEQNPVSNQVKKDVLETLDEI